MQELEDQKLYYKELCIYQAIIALKNYNDVQEKPNNVLNSMVGYLKQLVGDKENNNET